MPAKTWEDIETTPTIEYVPLGIFWSGDWSAPEDGIYVQTTGRDRLELLRQSTYDKSKVWMGPKRTNIFYAEPSNVSFTAGTMRQVAAVSNSLMLERHEVPGLELVELSYSETGNDFAAGILNNVEAVDGKLALEIEEMYGDNFASGKTYTADAWYSSSYTAEKAFDENTNTRWYTGPNKLFPHWIKVDLGSGNARAAAKLRLMGYTSYIKNFALQGSNDDSSWETIYEGMAEDNEQWQEFAFSNDTNYRYYRLYVTDNYTGDNACGIREIELMEWEPRYFNSGYRLCPPLALSALGEALDSEIAWQADKPSGTNVKIYTAVTDSDEDEPDAGDWAEQTSGGEITNIYGGDLTDKYLWIKQVLETANADITPALKSMAVSIAGEKEAMVLVYYEDGDRISPAIDLSAAGVVKDSRISWSADIPQDTALQLETSLSLNGGQTWGLWQTCTNGQAIPGLLPDMDLSNTKLRVRQTLETSDPEITPALHSVAISVEAKMVYLSLHDLAYDVLHDAELKDDEFWLDPELQQFPVPYAYFEPQTHREALRKIAEACVGQVYCDREGIVRVEGPSFAEKLQKSLAPYFIQGAPFATEEIEVPEAYGIGPDDYFSKDNPAKWAEIANHIEVETQPLRPDTASEVYCSNDPVPINAGQSITITAYYNHTPCIEAEASLEDAPAGAEITGATYYAWGAEVSISSSVAGSFVLVITARPLKILNKERVVVRDEASITENGLLKYTFPGNPLVQTVPVAQMIANTILASAKLARRDVELDWRGNPALELGDVIQVPDHQRDGIDERGYFVITRQEIEYNGALRARAAGKRITEEGGA